jgi:hypothetical protein
MSDAACRQATAALNKSAQTTGSMRVHWEHACAAHAMFATQEGVRPARHSSQSLGKDVVFASRRSAGGRNHRWVGKGSTTTTRVGMDAQ